MQRSQHGLTDPCLNLRPAPRRVDQTNRHRHRFVQVAGEIVTSRGKGRHRRRGRRLPLHRRGKRLQGGQAARLAYRQHADGVVGRSGGLIVGIGGARHLHPHIPIVPSKARHRRSEHHSTVWPETGRRPGQQRQGGAARWHRGQRHAPASIAIRLRCCRSRSQCDADGLTGRRVAPNTDGLVALKNHMALKQGVQEQRTSPLPHAEEMPTMPNKNG